VGGLVGAWEGDSMSNCYAIGKVNATTSDTPNNQGGLVGGNWGSTIDSCYWNTETTGQTTSDGSDTSYGKTTVEMKKQSTFAGWDFTGETVNGTNDYWSIDATKNYGYPYLSGQTPETTPGEVPVNLTVANTTVVTGEACFNATNEITVSTVTVVNNASANFIAGYSVTFLPGFHAVEGSYVHALITETASFCNVAGGSPIVEQPSVKSVENQTVAKNQATIPGEKSMKVYPNPNNGQFTLELTNIESGATVCIYNMLGARVYQSLVTNETNHKINLPGIKKGIYFVKVMDGKEQYDRKMVLN
jgi:hypothetical protein